MVITTHQNLHIGKVLETVLSHLYLYSVDFNKSLKNVNNIFLKEIGNTAVLNLKISSENNQEQSESVFLTMAFIFQTDLLLSRSETSFLVASMYCDVARLLLCSLLIDSFINSPLPCPARVAACGELMVSNGYSIHTHDVSKHFYFYTTPQACSLKY